jgi:hypothetical protein
MYSYVDSGCSDPVDPISVIFYENATINNVRGHAMNHGNWWNGDGNTQWFYDHFCGPMDGQASSNEEWDLGGRFHMRLWWNWDSAWHTYTLSTPHHEDVIVPAPWDTGHGCWPANHAVDSNWDESPGGFVRAKWDIGANWGPSGHHNWWGYWYWDNMDWQWQCDGQPAWNDGYVDFFPIY